MKIEFIPFGETTETKLDHCPYCKHKLCAASSVGKVALPSPGDFSICRYCGSLLRFSEGLLLRGATVDEETELQKHQPQMWADICRFQRLLRDAAAESFIVDFRKERKTQ